ncbi:MAG: hypothetical protein R2865_00850 [Deinococcales bacterium]
MLDVLASLGMTGKKLQGLMDEVHITINKKYHSF